VRKVVARFALSGPRFRLTLVRVRANDERHAGRSWQLARIALIYGCWFALVAWCYHRTPINFLRAESGWYQFSARDTPARQQQFVRSLFKESHNGHYAPLAFWLELEQTKLAGTRAGYWKWRAIALISLLGLTLFLLAMRAAAAAKMGTIASLCLSTGLTAIVLFQPLMIEFVAWPFLVFEIGWMIFSIVALAALVSLASDIDPKKSVWIAAGSAYASIHCFGLGLISVIATAMIFTLILVQQDRFGWLLPYRRRIVFALGFLILFGICHTLCMAGLNSVPAGGTPLISHDQLTRALLAFVGVYPLFVPFALFISIPLSPATAVLLQNAWPLGLVAVLVAIMLITAAIKRLRKEEPRHAAAVHLVLITFSFLSYAIMIALVTLREIRQPSLMPVVGMFVGPRYLVPSTIVFFGAMIAAVMALARKKTVGSAIAFLLLTICAVISQRQFASYVYPKLQPAAQISHKRAWSLIVSMAREARAAHLPVPDISMNDLTQEFHGWDLKLFEPLLRHDLNLSPEEPIDFLDVKEVLGPRRAEYDRSVPSLAELSRTMRIQSASSHQMK
jgi:hypothetical protein